MDELIVALIEEQERRGWSDREMARQIGIGHATWYRIRTGSRGMGTLVLRRVLQRFPRYSHLAMGFFLSHDAANISESASDSQEVQCA